MFFPRNLYDIHKKYLIFLARQFFLTQMAGMGIALLISKGICLRNYSKERVYMLVTMKDLLEHADKYGYAVMAPNIGFELEARACLKAAEKMQAPLILDVCFQESPDVIVQGWYLRALAEEACVPVAINQDHGSDFAHAIAAIRGGYTGIMVDRSFLPFEENAAQVKELTRIAHAVGVTVEAELGHVGDAKDCAADRQNTFTKPEEARDFVDQTGVDCLAVAIGTAHGLYKGTPELDFVLLAQLKQELNMPLVLHGGSGTGDENIRRACTMGINKVNVFSELIFFTYQALLKADYEKESGELIWQHIIDAHCDRLCELIRISGSAGKSWAGRIHGLHDKKTVFDAMEIRSHFL